MTVNLSLVVNEAVAKLSEEFYREGFADGLRAYAHWKDGAELVGTTGTTLKEAVENMGALWNYSPNKARGSNDDG